MCGFMTFIGAAGHTLPFLLPSFNIALAAAMIVVAVELGAIAWIRHRYMDTALAKAVFQIVVGGVVVFVAGILIGRS